MRKLAVVMAVLLLLSCVPAAAAGETALTGVEAYQQYGPWYTWTQEQKDSAVADWSEEFWGDYWDAYFDILERVRNSFETRGIEMTYPHLNVHMAPAETP